MLAFVRELASWHPNASFRCWILSLCFGQPKYDLDSQKQFQLHRLLTYGVCAHQLSWIWMAGQNSWKDFKMPHLQPWELHQPTYAAFGNGQALADTASSTTRYWLHDYWHIRTLVCSSKSRRCSNNQGSKYHISSAYRMYVVFLYQISGRYIYIMDIVWSADTPSFIASNIENYADNYKRFTFVTSAKGLFLLHMQRYVIMANLWMPSYCMLTSFSKSLRPWHT